MTVPSTATVFEGPGNGDVMRATGGFAMKLECFRHELVGCLSQGAAGNPTGVIMEAAFAHHELPWRYINCEVAPADLGSAAQGLRALGFRGFNLSMPHKVSILPLLDGLGESARMIGAVNCVVRRDGRLIGENTDGKGFLMSLQRLVDPRGKNVLLFGAGGAARAIAVELALAGADRIAVVNRSEARADELVSLLRDRTKTRARFIRWEGEYEVPRETDVVVNATSIGLYDENARLALAPHSLAPGMVAADVVFNPPGTRFIQDSARRGCATLDGLGMLVNQAAIGIRYWTGVDADVAVMRRALEKALKLP